MKRFLKAVSALAAIIILTIPAEAALSDYGDEIYSRAAEADISEIGDSLKELGIDSGDPSSVSNLSPEGVSGYILKLLRGAVSRPAKIILTVVCFAAICKLATSLSTKAGLYGELFAILCFVSIAPSAAEAFNSAISAMKSCHAFMISYIPAFAAVVASSGNVTAAISYNAVLLYFCEGAAFLASGVFRPILCCMLVLSAAQAVNPDISNLTGVIKRILTSLIGFIMTIFLGILGLQTIIGRGVDGLAVRAGKYAVSSFVPIIGYSLSESYNAVSVSLSAIRTTVGAFGIVVLCLFILSPIITAWVYKTAFLICCWICRLIGADSIASLTAGAADVFGLLSTVLIFFMLMLTVSTGALIILGGVLQS